MTSSEDSKTPVTITVRVSSSYFHDIVPEYTLAYETDRVANLKALVRDGLDEPRPDEPNMIFIFRGRILEEKERLKDLVAPFNNNTGHVTFHMLVRSDQSDQVAGSRRTSNTSSRIGSTERLTPTSTERLGSTISRERNGSINGGITDQSIGMASNVLGNHSQSTSNQASSTLPATTSASATSPSTTSDAEESPLKHLVATDGFVTVEIPAYEYLILDGQIEGEKAFALAPNALKQIEETFSPRHDIETVSLQFTPREPIRVSSTPIESVETRPTTTTPGTPDAPATQDTFDHVADNGLFRLDLNYARLSRLLRIFLFSLTRMCILSLFLFVKARTDTTKLLVLGLACLLIAYEYGLFEHQLGNFRQRIIDNLPHGLPRDVRLELYSHIWDRGQDQEHQEQPEQTGIVESTDADEELDEITSIINRGRRLPATIKCMVCMFIGSLHPAIYTLWIKEEDRRRREVAENIREFRRAAEERRNEGTGVSTGARDEEN